MIRWFSVVLVLIAGCGGTGDTSCTPMMMPSELAQRAALLRLDVFDETVHCDGATVTAGAPPPTLSKAAPAGQPIKLDIPEGMHTLLLSAFADAAGTQLIASACTEAHLSAGTGACFNLTLAEAPDGSVADTRQPCSSSPDNCPLGQFCAGDGECAPGCKGAPDCAQTATTPLCDVGQHRCVQCLVPSDCPAGKRCSPSGTCVDGCDVMAGSLCAGSNMCCSNLCIDTSTELSSCGACGRACSGDHVAAASCANSQCAPTCNNGWGDCNHPIAPAADDGCETNLHDVANCGGCNNVCNLQHAMGDCPSGTCVIKKCDNGYFDCDGNGATGCECPGVDLKDGMNGCCAGGQCQVQHSDGYSHNFFDCTPFGTYTQALATEAAHAYDSSMGANVFPATLGTVSMICYRNPAGTVAISWAYADTANAVVGRTHVNNSMGGTPRQCYAPTAADLPWE
jgi:hypothetical protein